MNQYPGQGGYPPQGSSYPQQNPYATGAYAAQPQGQYQQPQMQQGQYQPQQQQGYPPNGGYPQQGYPPQYPGQVYGAVPMGVPVDQMQHSATVVVIPQSSVITGFGGDPTACVCPNCKAQVTTIVESVPGGMAWLSCFVLLIIGAWPCMFIPFCVDTCMDVSHICPNCRIVIRRRTAFDSA